MELLGLIFSIAFVAGVIGNLVASVIWATPAGLALARKLHHVHASAQATHRIAADTHEHLTGQRHDLAPDDVSEGK